MAKRKAPELSPEAVAANAAGEARREKEKRDRQRNAEKQKRFRDGMKAEGYRRVTLWDLPSPAGKRMAALGFRQVPAWEYPQSAREKSRAVKIKCAVQIRETSLNAAARLPQVKKALARATSEFLLCLGGAPEARAVYHDYLELVKLLGDPFGEE